MLNIIKHLSSRMVILSILLFGLQNSAWAYIDPGTGSLIIQTIIGAIAAIGVTMKLYWHKLKLMFSSRSNEQDSTTKTTPPEGD